MRFDSYHPAINLLYFAAVIAAAAVFDHPCCIAAAYVCSFLYSTALGGRRALVFDLTLIPLGAAFALFYASYRHFGVTVLAMNFIGNQITLEALVSGVVMAAKTASVLMWCSCFLRVFSSDKLVYLLGRAAPRLALYLAVVLRAVPRMAERWRAVSRARSGVGRGLGQGTPGQRVRHFGGILSIVTTWTLEDFVESAASMQSRGAALKGRTAFSIYRFDNRDRALVLVLAALITTQLMAWLLDQTKALYDPLIVVNPVTPVSFVFYALYALLGLLPWLLQLLGALRWRRRIEKKYR